MDANVTVNKVVNVNVNVIKQKIKMDYMFVNVDVNIINLIKDLMKLVIYGLNVPINYW